MPLSVRKNKNQKKKIKIKNRVNPRQFLFISLLICTASQEVKWRIFRIPVRRRRNSWLYTRVAEDFNSGLQRTNPANGQSELELWASGFTSPQLVPCNDVDFEFQVLDSGLYVQIPIVTEGFWIPWAGLRIQTGQDSGFPSKSFPDSIF